jgi:hypothetical protein
MALPSTAISLNQAFVQVLGQAGGIKQQAVDALAALQAGPVTTTWVFNFLDVVKDAIGRFDRFKTIAGLNAYATQQAPAYSGTLTTDIAATETALQACIDWVITNFPKDSTNTWILAYQLNADSTRTPRSFSTVQTAGLQTLLQTLIATIT